MREITTWVSPFTALNSLDDAIAMATAMARPGWHANLLLPLHYGQWPQAQCRQSLPSDMRVSGPADVAGIRSKVEALGLGFGGWGVPHDGASAELAGQFAEASGFYVANFEPELFWTPGDDPLAIDDWWSRFWNAMTDQNAMGGNVAATVVPNQWGIGAFRLSLSNLAAGCEALALEVYGGLQTKGRYPPPNLWPDDGFRLVRQTGVEANLIPILAEANLASQFLKASWLGQGNTHVWHV
jgi:hypothetical protein